MFGKAACILEMPLVLWQKKKERNLKNLSVPQLRSHYINDDMLSTQWNILY